MVGQLRLGVMGMSEGNQHPYSWSAIILATIHVFMDIAPAGELNVYGAKGNLSVDHGGTYTSFRNTAEEAIKGFQQGLPCIDFDKTRNVISALIAGRQSLESGGKRVEVS